MSEPHSVVEAAGGEKLQALAEKERAVRQRELAIVMDMQETMEKAVKLTAAA
jgi:hypothetical protein